MVLRRTREHVRGNISRRHGGRQGELAAVIHRQIWSSLRSIKVRLRQHT